MKVSKTRLETALQLRDMACRILKHIGAVTTIGNSRGDCAESREAKINDLIILCSRTGGEDLLDIWQGIKVFSISWNDSGPYVVAFRPGTWQRLLVEADIELGWSRPSRLLFDGSNQLLPATGKWRRATDGQTH
jgi:hypothetical protein